MRTSHRQRTDRHEEIHGAVTERPAHCRPAAHRPTNDEAEIKSSTDAGVHWLNDAEILWRRGWPTLPRDEHYRVAGFESISNHRELAIKPKGAGEVLRRGAV
jgi:hypothetical protein